MMTTNFLKKNFNGNYVVKGSYVSLKQRVIGILTAAFLLLQVCVPGIAAAATLLSNDSITKAMTDPSFQASLDSNYLFQQAAYVTSQPVNSKDISSFHEEMRSAGLNVGTPSFVPVAGDVTIFVPTYPVGRLIGDSYVQARYVRQQITDLLGRHMIDAATDGSEITQINRLYSNSKTFAVNNRSTYKYGDNLPASQSITLDMIWPEKRIINGQQVMVPIVYLSPATINKYAVNDHKIEFLGRGSTFKTVSLDHTKLQLGPNSVLTTVKDLRATNSTISGNGNVELVVGGTLQNNFSTIDVDKNLTIIANTYNAKTLLVPFTDRYGSGYRLGRVASVNAGGNISISSYGDINLEGAVIKSANGSITLNAQNNINIAPVYMTYNGASTQGQWQVTNASVDIVGSKLTAQETVKLVAGGAINITASELTSTKGGIELLAQQGIYVVDELTQEQIQKIDRKGKTKGQSSEFRTEAVRSVLKAGKGVLLDTEFGDVQLKAAEITSTSGAQVTAKNGTVHLLMTKELEEFHLQTVRKGTWTIKTRTEDVIHENNIQNAIVGGLQVQARYGINVEYTGKKDATLREQVDEFRKIPELKWMADLYDQNLSAANGALNWEKLEEIHKEVKKTKRNLSPAAMAIISIAVAVAMGPVGAQLVGSTGSGLAASIAGSVNNAALGAAMAAGTTTLATQAATSLLAGNSPAATINQMTSSESLKSLAVSMVTAGAMQHTDSKIFDAVKGDSLNVSLAAQAGKVVVESTIRAGISVTINGGSSADYLNAFKANLATGAVEILGEKMANKIGSAYNEGNGSITNTVRYIAHAGAGCVYGIASAAATGNAGNEKYSCFSGAGGAVIGELVADQFKDHYKIAQGQKATEEWLEKIGISEENNIAYENLSDAKKTLMKETMPANFISAAELNDLRRAGVDLAKLGAGLAAFVAKADVNIAASAGANAAEHNAFPLVIYGAMLALSALSTYLLIEDTVELGHKLTDDGLTEAEKEELIKDYAVNAGISVGLTLSGMGALKGVEKLIELARTSGKNADVIAELQNLKKSLEKGNAFEADGDNNLIQAPMTPVNPMSANSRVILREQLAAQAGVPRKLEEFWGASLDDIKRAFEMDGAVLTTTSGKHGEGFKLGGHELVEQVYKSNGGSRHGGPYIKFDMKDGSQIKIMEPSNYLPGTIQPGQRFYDRNLTEYIRVNSAWVVK